MDPGLRPGSSCCMRVARGGHARRQARAAAAVGRPPPATRGFLDRKENPLAPLKRHGDAAARDRASTATRNRPRRRRSRGTSWAIRSITRWSPRRPARDRSSTTRLQDRAHARRQGRRQADPARADQPERHQDVSRRATSARVYTIGDSDAPHLKGVLIVVNTQFVAYPDESGQFQIPTCRPAATSCACGTATSWIDRTDDDVYVAAKGKTEINPKIAGRGMDRGGQAGSSCGVFLSKIWFFLVALAAAAAADGRAGHAAAGAAHARCPRSRRASASRAA